jgi:hypothetical protein
MKSIYFLDVTQRSLVDRYSPIICLPFHPEDCSETLLNIYQTIRYDNPKGSNFFNYYAFILNVSGNIFRGDYVCLSVCISVRIFPLKKRKTDFDKIFLNVEELWAIQTPSLNFMQFVVRTSRTQEHDMEATLAPLLKCDNYCNHSNLFCTSYW